MPTSPSAARSRGRSARSNWTRALALEPDLASVLSGLNDMLRRDCDVGAVIGELDTMIGALRGAGAEVLTFTLPDPVPINPIAKSAAARLRHLNAAIRDLTVAHGARLVDLEAYPVASDRRLWDLDRLHANPLGHERIAAAAAEALRAGRGGLLVDDRLPGPADAALARVARGLGGALPGALGAAAAARRVLGRRDHREAARRSSGSSACRPRGRLCPRCVGSRRPRGRRPARRRRSRRGSPRARGRRGRRESPSARSRR